MPEVELSAIDLSDGMSKHALCDQIASIINKDSYDILLTYRCPYIIPEGIFQQFAIRMNIHPLPLPKYAGLNPWDSFFESGCKQAHAVLHNMANQPDAGEIIMQESYSFQTCREARDIADEAAAKMIEKYLAIRYRKYGNRNERLRR